MADEFPLILLSKLGLPELARSFSAYLESSEDVILFREQSRQHVEVSFCGVRFSCKFGIAKEGLLDAKQVMLNSDLAESTTSISIGFSGLVDSALPILPLVKSLLELASKFAASLPVAAVLWAPANIASGPKFFRNSVDDFVSGGAFPSLALVRFNSAEGNILRTNGLAWFSNQEVEFNTSDMDENEAIRRLVRIIHDIAENGAMAENIEVAGLDAGERLSLSVSAEEGVVRVRQTSKTDI